MVISNVTLVDVECEKVCDIEVEDGKILSIAEANSLKSDMDATGLYFLESLIDTNVILKDATLSGSNLTRLALKAKKGGVGLVVLNPECKPAINSSISLEFVQKHQLYSEDKTLLESSICAINDEGSLSNIAILLKKGAKAISITTNVDGNVLSKVAQYAKMYDVTIMCKAEESSLKSCGVMSEGSVSTHLGLGTISPLSEIIEVAKVIEIARYYDVKVLFRSIAQPRSIELITQAKAEGIQVSCEVTLFHLTHNDSSCQNFNTISKIDPPLLVESDRVKLVEALQAGKIDQLTTLHRSYSPIYKEVAFFDAEYGSEMIEYALPLYYTKLVKSGAISMSKLIELSVEHPSQCISEEGGKIFEGKEGSFLLFDSSKVTTIHSTMSLYHNEEIYGKIIKAF